MADLKAHLNGKKTGYAKLQGEHFDYFMQAHSIILGRSSKKEKVDLDVSVHGGGMEISRRHACIFYDFQRRRFALEVLGKNGCIVQGVLYFPGHGSVKLNSQDFLKIGQAEFYFLLPTRSIEATVAAWRTHIPSQLLSSSFMQSPHPHSSDVREYSYGNDYGRDNGIRVGTEAQGKFMNQSKRSSGELDIYSGYPINVEPVGAFGERVNKLQIRREDKDTYNHRLLKEEKDVISSVATLVSDNCGPGEWMPVAKLHSELIEHFGKRWPHSKVQNYLTPEDGSSTETKGRPWYNLLELLKEYPEHFVINAVIRGKVTSEFVSLVSLLS